MKKWQTAVGVAAVMLVCAGTVAAVSLRQDPRTPAPPQGTGVTTDAAVYRVLGEWNGKLAVFLPESGTPETVYEVWVSTLPEEEQARLHAGVAVATRRELQSLIEDYTG